MFQMKSAILLGAAAAVFAVGTVMVLNVAPISGGGAVELAPGWWAEQLRRAVIPAVIAFLGTAVIVLALPRTG